MEDYFNSWILAFASALITALIVGPIFIPMLRKFKIGQSVRKEGPKSHLKKSGTPTMGGLIMFIAISLALLINIKNLDMDVALIFISMFLFGLVGFIDDYLIVVRKDNTGLRPKQKLALQIIFGIFLAGYKYMSSVEPGFLKIPFMVNPINIGLLYIPFIVFVSVGTVNSVNLTDGIDGLASSVTFIVAGFFLYLGQKVAWPGVAYFAAAMMGALLGFLAFNKYPAKVFMGDTGSMGLGGGIVAMAILTDSVMFLPIIGGIYFIETLSVIIQVTGYKYKKKRIFLMSPIHHHLEHKGWHEKKIVFIFSAISLLLVGIGLLGYK